MTIPLPSSAASAPRWRREPYRLFFPLGLALTWWAVLHWLLMALGVTDAYRSIFHAMAQVQGFMDCFAVGFLLTLIPRRTQTAPPAAWQMIVLALCPVALVACAWLERWAVSQVFWLVQMAVLIGFLAPRALRARGTGRIPDAFVWVAAAIAIAVAAAVFTGVSAAMGRMDLHDLGRAVLLQGMFSCLVLGIGSMLIPIVTRGEPPAFGPGRTASRVGHALGVLVYLSSFEVEHAVSTRIGFAMRAAVCLAVLLLAARIHRLPSVPGLHRRLVWIAAWMLPIGNAAVAAFPSYPKAGLHVIFIGCFALLAFSISIHVALSHGGHSEPLSRWPVPAIAMAALIACALIARVLVDADFPRRTAWIGIAAACFLAATVFWAVLVAPSLRGEPVPGA